ncbi:putative small glutamine-rich tetratricopeptide repeat-containing protein alpha isoform X2 [Apostichopus japonicus]|uniref:Putative small glutamine-rich tetratricopeptide repeat-containing protein alpha isoform X2 n=2 Tax=Stichopus japonicus TaxID=307972 RepID=A0A2G8JBB1_STIJA|nr:putative small glutamine-rich tetratricopeptide repeat-containing protein alpha isoform X2 [Apostichopus japonicus]
MSNPALMNMASSMLQNPNMQQMMQSMMGQAMQGTPDEGGTEGPAAMGNLLQMGQQLASQIQTENPELVEQVRQMTQNPNSYDGDNNNQPPPEPPADGNNS